jgi:AraC-like DNA-binding protein
VPRSNHAHIGARSASPTLASASGERLKHRSHTVSNPVESSADVGRLRRFPTAPDALQPVALTYAMQDYAAEVDEPLPIEVETVMSLGDPCHYRMHVTQAFGNGHAEFYGISDGFFFHFSDFTAIVPHVMSVSAPNMLRVRIASDGDGEYAPASGDRLDMKGPAAAIIIEPPGQPPAEAALAGYNHMAHVYIHCDALKRLYVGCEQELPAVIQAFIAGNLQRTIARRLPLGPGLRRCLDDMHNCMLEGRSRRLFIQSKAVEILCHAFEALEQEEGFGSCEALTLTTRAVLKAQRLLIENFVTPPSLDDLAQEVGLSRSGLCAGFREIMGQTVFDYIADLRMQHALAMLNQRNASITQIAYAVGYNHSSSFSVAVQRRFGITPSELRRRGLPIV